MDSSGLSCLNLPVYTVSGQYLGRISGIEVDASARVVTCYQVSSALPLSRLWQQQLLIKPEQVVSLSQERMVVDDSAIRREAAVAPSIVPETS